MPYQRILILLTLGLLGNAFAQIETIDQIDLGKINYLWNKGTSKFESELKTNKAFLMLNEDVLSTSSRGTLVMDRRPIRGEEKLLLGDDVMITANFATATEVGLNLEGEMNFEEIDSTPEEKERGVTI